MFENSKIQTHNPGAILIVIITIADNVNRFFIVDSVIETDSFVQA
jgi:hypothetical protein